MPYRRSLGRFSNRTWEEFSDDVHRARNEHLMEGIISGCAIVAYADGWVTQDERSRMLGLIRGFEPIAAFGLDDALATFEALSDRFVEDHDRAERESLEAVAKLRGTKRYPVLLVEACCAIAAADGGFDAEERGAAIRICKVLGLDPAQFNIADAR
jgi:tellurite resistance protein TerB